MDKFHRTPTPTCPLGMRLSCNIVYHVQYTYTCKRAHPQRTSSRSKARVRTKVGPTSRRAERAAERPAAACAGHADFLATILARKSARKSVSVSVSVSVLWNLALTAWFGLLTDIGDGYPTGVYIQHSIFLRTRHRKRIERLFVSRGTTSGLQRHEDQQTLLHSLQDFQ